ncbi:hypothetical protein RB195_023992 [Necator americanus]|uniref:Uncharacterized protein n=1 Tax=Necator americanus TaxID=51031 RepID=A0ABR1ELF0_NECAM
MWVSLRSSTGIRVDGLPIKLVNYFCYLGSMVNNDGSYERDIQKRCAKANLAFNSWTKCLWSESAPIANEVKLQVYLSAIRPIMYRVRQEYSKPLQRLLGYSWPLVCHNEELYSEVDMVCRRMTCEKRQHLGRPSEIVMENRPRFFGHVMRRPSGRLVQIVLRMLLDLNWKRLPGRKRKF